MKNTGAWNHTAGSCHGAVIYATYRIVSAARLSDILPGSYRVNSQSPGSSHRTRLGKIHPSRVP